MSDTVTVIPPPDGGGVRLDIFLASAIPEHSRSFYRKLIDGGDVTVDGVIRKSSYLVSPGERIVVRIPPPVPDTPIPEPIPLSIVFEDDDLLVIDKPAGMTVHPGAGHRSGTLVNALLSHCRDLPGIGGVERPGIVHRIDKGTTGLLVVAKSERAHRGLSELFRRHDIQRRYVALVYGTPAGGEGTVRSLIARHPTDRLRMSGRVTRGRESVTHWRVIESMGEISMVELSLETGRTHQIRVHLTESGHPLLGDHLYGGEGRYRTLSDPLLRKMVKELGRPALHAQLLGFVHPVTGELLTFSTPLPDDMERIITQARQTSPCRHD